MKLLISFNSAIMLSISNLLLHTRKFWSVDELIFSDIKKSGKFLLIMDTKKLKLHSGRVSNCVCNVMQINNKKLLPNLFTCCSILYFENILSLLIWYNYLPILSMLPKHERDGQHAKVFAIKPDDLYSISETPMAGENQLL